jgi:hypothetical protein
LPHTLEAGTAERAERDEVLDTLYVLDLAPFAGTSRGQCHLDDLLEGL